MSAGDSDDSAEPHAGVGVLTATAAAGGGPAAGPSTAAPAALRHQTRADPHPARAATAAPNRQGGAAVPEGATSDSDGGAEAAGDSGDEEGEAIARLKGAGARLQAQQSRAQAEASGLEVVAQVWSAALGCVVRDMLCAVAVAECANGRQRMAAACGAGAVPSGPH